MTASSKFDLHAIPSPHDPVPKFAGLSVAS
jgi:hypothetical protein